MMSRANSALNLQTVEHGRAGCLQGRAAMRERLTLIARHSSMSKMPKRDEDCCVDILALVHGGPTTTDEIERHVDRAAGLYACDIAIRRTAKALNRVVHPGNSQSIQVWQNADLVSWIGRGRHFALLTKGPRPSSRIS